MSGVIDENGQQWEPCNRCGRYVMIQTLLYEPSSKQWRWGRDICARCWKHKDEDITPKIITALIRFEDVGYVEGSYVNVPISAISGPPIIGIRTTHIPSGRPITVLSAKTVSE